MSTESPAADSPADESQFVEQLARGDAKAFERLVRVHGPRMLCVARRIVGREEDAHDAVQDAFLSAHRSIGGFTGNARLETWLHRIVVNAALMKLRTARRRPETSLDELLPQFLDDGHQARPSKSWRAPVEDWLLQSETAELVRHSIDQLPENYRIVLVLRDIEELDTDETARLLNLAPGAVKTRLHRARQALRTLLDPHFRDEP